MTAPLDDDTLDDDTGGFSRMLEESLTGLAFDPAPGRAAVEAALREFERRDRALRFLAWGTVGAMSLLAAWAAWSFFDAPADASTKRLVLDATVFLWASLGIAFGKLWLFTTQAQLATQRELKRLELALLDRRAHESAS